MSAENLKKLHTSLVDNRKGYAEAVKDTDSPPLKTLFADMLALKERDHSELHACLTRLGEQPDDSGSFMATIHKTVIKVRSATTGLESALAAFVMGEEEVMGEYNKAIEECAADPTTVATLTRQRDALGSKITIMKGMK